MTSPWIAYNDLAWTEDWLANSTDYEDEVATYLGLIQQYAAAPPQALLHLGSGAGGMDHSFKRHFTVTGVDLSAGMLAKARATHPDIEYLEGDMRTLRLGRLFDAVAIPDSIDYMATLDDLRSAIATAVAHLKPGGVLLVVGKPQEQFQNNNFAYTGERQGIHITLLENNYINPHHPNTYEATLIYLVRQSGELMMHHDRHILGLFPQATWEQVFRDAGLTLHQHSLDGLYDPYLLAEGSYPQTIFVGVN